MEAWSIRSFDSSPNGGGPSEVTDRPRNLLCILRKNKGTSSVVPTRIVQEYNTFSQGQVWGSLPRT